MTNAGTPQAEPIAAMRKAARRTGAQGRRWYLRAVLMAVIAGVAFYRGAQFNNLLGIGMTVLAALSFSLGRGMRRDAKQMEEKLGTMERG